MTERTKLGWHKVTGRNENWGKNYVTYFYVTHLDPLGIVYHEFLVIEGEEPEYLGEQMKPIYYIPEGWEQCECQNKEVLRLYEEITTG